MKKVITYGTFDLFHKGHENLLRRAKELGDYLIVGVTTDQFDMLRGKMNTHDSLMTRIESVKASGYADEIILEEYKGQKISDILKYGVDIFAIGSDWEGKFDYLSEYCKVVYLPRTQGVSSTMIRTERRIHVGLIGTGEMSRRFVKESSVVQAISIDAGYDIDPGECRTFCEKHSIARPCSSPEELYSNCDAVYVATPHYTHYDYVKAALLAGKHVICETPFVLHTAQAEELFNIADEKNLVLVVAHKTAYCPAFGQLVFAVRSGVIGDVVDINASVTTLTDEKSPLMDASLFGGSMSENACFPSLPIVKILGSEFRNINFYSKMKNGVDIYTKAVFLFDGATASFQVGLGAKTEGSMTISGTLGYIYVPAPWWKTDYFEFRFEDQNQNKKFFMPFVGDGLRYEIKAFATSIQESRHVYQVSLSRDEVIAMTRIQEQYLNGINLVKLK